MPRPMHNPPPGFAMPTEEQRRRALLERTHRTISAARHRTALEWTSGGRPLDDDERRAFLAVARRVLADMGRPLTSSEQEVVDGGGELHRWENP